jgi:hypothetical protein
MRWVNMLKGKPEKDAVLFLCIWTDMVYSRIFYYINSAVNYAFFTVKPLQVLPLAVFTYSRTWFFL